MTYLKMSCPACSGHLEYPEDGVGEQIECPHCRVPIILTDDQAWDIFNTAKGPLDKSQIRRVERARLAQMKSVGIKFVGILGAGGMNECAPCRAIRFTRTKNGTRFEIQSVPELPLAGCNKKNCMCIYIALE